MIGSSIIQSAGAQPLRILVTGGNGQLAFDLKQIGAASDGFFTMYAPGRDELDITNFQLVHDCLDRIKPDFVINTAAYTQVDRAEEDAEHAFAVNRDGAKNLAILCEKFKCPLIHISTDYVFDGMGQRPYKEIDPVAPVNLYGESKLRGEVAIQAHCEKYIILRVSAVFGFHGHNFVKTMLRLAREKEELRIVADQMTCPTSAASIAEVLLQICSNPQWGVFHYCGASVVSWYDFARSIFEIACEHETLRVKHVQAVTTNDYPTLAKRPLFSVLNCDKLKETFGIQQPQWKIGLNDVINSLYTA
jgi:dTDP-4-dehydrorhamnose reductase